MLNVETFPFDIQIRRVRIISKCVWFFDGMHGYVPTYYLLIYPLFMLDRKYRDTQGKKLR